MTSGCPAFQKHVKHAEGSDTSYVSHTRKALSTECENRNFDRNEKRLRSPAGPRRLGTATRISASLFRRLSASFWRTPGQDPKAAKFAVLTPGPGMFVNVRNAPRVVIPPPIRNTPVSPCVPLCAIFLREPSVYPFSSVKANVGHLCEKLKIGMRNGWGQSCGGIFADVFSSADGEGSQRTGKCMYIKAWREKIFTGIAKPRCGRGREGPCFAVCAVVCDPSPKAECVPTFTRESERGPFVREVENRDEKWFETALWR